MKKIMFVFVFLSLNLSIAKSISLKMNITKGGQSLASPVVVINDGETGSVSQKFKNDEVTFIIKPKIESKNSDKMTITLDTKVLNYESQNISKLDVTNKIIAVSGKAVGIDWKNVHSEQFHLKIEPTILK